MTAKTQPAIASPRDRHKLTAPDAAPAEVGELDLYQKRERIYTRRVEGFYQRIRLFTGWPLLLGYFITPWLSWDGRQLILFDLPARQFHIIGLTFWPQDFNLLAWLLIIAAFSLFLVTTWAGRLWCGYSCPQTVWTSIFMWAEQIAEGTRNQRIKLDQMPWTHDKVIKKTAKHAMWLGFALLTGITFIGYFTPIRELVPALLQFSANFWAVIWTVFFTLATYINAGWLREQVCTYICPYARFQSVMFDKDTLIVAYHKGLGEPRGARKKGSNPTDTGKGRCVDCRLCVQVCPTGIDIRDGLQYRCINCALCIDACNAIMDKMGYPRNLISYTSEHLLAGEQQHRIRPRLVGYSVVLAVMIAAFSYQLITRIPLELDVIRDRNTLYTEAADGRIENIYTLKIINMDRRAHRYRLTVAGVPDPELVGNTHPYIASGEVLALPIRVRAMPHQPGSHHSLTFSVAAEGDRSISDTQVSRFVTPATPR